MIGIDRDFGNWLAGFIDGEGCFRVHKEKRGGYYACHFTLKVRDDDAPIIREIVERTEIGYVKSDASRSGSNPCVVWTVASKIDCLNLRDFLDVYQMRARKREDWLIWREAVGYWVAMKRGNRWDGPRDWSEMVRFKEAIEAVRTYRGPR